MTRNIFDIFDAILGQKSPLLSALTPSEYRPFWRLYNYEEGKPDNPAGKKSIDFDEEMAERLIRIVKRKKEGYYKDIERGLASATISRLYNNLFEAFSDWFT